jgi:thiamine-monophosphate kinase
MKVSDVGEFGLIDLLNKLVSTSQKDILASNQKLILSIGDDAAAWQCDSSIQLATVDSVIEDVHFSLKDITWRELGWKSLAVNISDIAAMGGTPKYALVALALPGGTDVEDVTALYDGMLEIANRFRVAIIGGNTCQAPEVSITITVIGEGEGKHLLRRSAARPGDKVAVTGYPGSAAAGLEMFTKKLTLDKVDSAFLRNAFFRPVPRVAEGQMLVKLGVAAGLDISDGILSDLGHICESSRVSARIQAALLPIHPAVKNNFGDTSLRLAMAGGEDYELLFTASEEIIHKVQKESSIPVTIIGEITTGQPGKIEVIDSRGNPIDTGKAGWDHFKSA